MNRIKLWVLSLLGNLGDFLKAIFIRGISNQINAILPIAYEVVKMVEADPSLITGDEKRKAALASLSKRLITNSIYASISTLAFAIELAVQKMKAEKEKDKGGK